MAKKSYALKQLLPEDKPQTGTKYLVRKIRPCLSEKKFPKGCDLR